MSAGSDTMAAERATVRTAVDELLERWPPNTTPARAFLQARYDAGLAWVWFPKGFGGLGVAPNLQNLADRAITAAGGANTTVGSVGYMMTASAVVMFGTDELKHRFLPGIYGHDWNWVQLFSEPGAGSDLAGLATRATRDGDEWLISGQKVWSSGAMTADWGLLVARTDPDVPKHNGLTMFLIDMRQPGVEPRPLRNITGTAEFAEVFFSEARVRDELRLGDVGEGWKVALTVLMNERVNFTADFAGAEAPRPEGPMLQARELFAARAAQDPIRRERFLSIHMKHEVNRLNNLRAAARAQAGTPGPEGSIGKVATTELTKTVANLAMELLGAEGTVLPQPYPSADSDVKREALTELLQFNFLESPSNTIMGGTSEIQRNNIAERVLGLPGEPRLDRGVPWKDIPRNG